MVSFTRSLNKPATYLTVGIVFVYDMRMGPNTPNVPVAMPGTPYRAMTIEH